MKNVLILMLCIPMLGLSLNAKPPSGDAAAQDAAAPATAVSTLQNGSFQEGTRFWKIQPKGDSAFSLSDSVPAGVTGKSLRYQREGEDSPVNYCFSQLLRFKAGVYYRLSFQYKGDAKLAPMILLRDDGKKGTTRKLFRLTASKEWQRYEVEFTMGNTNGVYQLAFYPGSAPNFYLKNPGDANGGRPGKFYFADVALAETKRTDQRPPAGPYKVKTEKVIYKKTDTIDLAAYVDVPVGCKGPFPVVVMIHGGGWTKGGPEVMAPRSAFLVERGLATVRIQYRLLKDGGTFPKTISDVTDSIEWVRQNAKRYDFDMTRVGLTGGSAGGHLSSIAAQRTPECNVYMGFCGLYDAYEVGEGLFARRAHFVGEGEQDRKDASAIYQIKTPPPATILFHGLADATIDYNQAVRFAEALQMKGARTELVLNEGCGHEVGNPELVNRRMLAFLNREWELEMEY
jgi:acetyl esterase/lipase